MIDQTSIEAPPAPVEPVNLPAISLRRLAKNSSANLLRLGAGWIILLIVPPMLVRLMDRSSYAAWMLVLQFGAYVTLFDGGLQLTVGRYVARAEHERQEDYLGRILSSASALLACGAAIVFGILAALALFLPRLFPSIPAAIAADAQSSLLIVSGSIALAFPASVLAGFYLGMEKNEITAITGVSAKVLSAAGALWAAFHHEGIVRMSLWTASGILLQPVVLLILNAHLEVWRYFQIRFVSFPVVKEFARFSAAMMVSQFSMLLITGLDLPIVAAFDFPNAGYYALATMVSNMLVVPHGAILSTIVPSMSSMSLSQSSHRMGEILIRTTRIAATLLVLWTVPLMLGMPLFLRLWVGVSYARHTLLLGELLVGAQVIRLTTMPYTLIGFSAGEQRQMLASPIAESIVNVVCSLALAKMLGAAGVALGTLIGAMCGVTLHFVVSMRRTRSITFARKSLWWQGIVQPIGLAMLPVAVLAPLLISVRSVISQVFILFLATGSVALLSWRFQLKSEERIAILRLIRIERLDSRAVGV